jgi:Na+/melibiose symporter-like transporter
MESNDLLDVGLNEQQKGRVFGRDSRYYLSEAAKWSKTVSIFCFIFLSLFVLVVVMNLVSSFVFKTNTLLQQEDGIWAWALILALVAAGFGFYVANQLYQFSKHAKSYLTGNNMVVLERCMEGLYLFLKTGAIISIVFYILFVLFSVAKGG